MIKKTLKYIKNWHDSIDKQPKKYCKDIHLLRKLIENLMQSEEIFYDEKDVNAFVELCALLKQREGRWAGLPLELSDEQKYIVACVLGFKIIDIELHIPVRYFRELILFVARKWGKSTFIAALNLYMLVADKENAAQVWCLATIKTQAAIVYESTKALGFSNRTLSKYIKTKRDKDNTEMLLFPATNSFMKAGSKNSNNQDGLNPSCYSIDELHAIKDRNTYDVFSSATGARTQPLGIIISTFGFEREGIFDSIFSRCQDVLTGKTNERIFPMIFRIDDEDDPADRSCWIKANPCLGSHPTMSYLEGEYQKAINDPAQMPSFLAKHLNRASNNCYSFFDIQKINAGARELSTDDYYGKYAVGGADLAETTDLCNTTCTIPIGDTFIILQKYFIAEKRLELLKQNDELNYRGFTFTQAQDLISQNIMEVVPGSMVKREHVTAWFNKLRDEFDITFLRIGYDRWHAGDWIESMNNEGYPQCEIAKGNEIKSGIMYPILTNQRSMISQPMKETKVLFDDGKIFYSKWNGIFRWCCNNTSASADPSGFIKPEKPKLGSNKRIDGYCGFLYSYMAYLTCKEIFDEFQS